MRVRDGVTASGAGVLLALCFPPFDAPWWCLLIALAAWMHLVRGRAPGAALLLTALFGLAFQLLLLRWMLVIGIDAWLALSVLETCFLLPVGVALALVRRAPVFLLVAALGVPAQDWLRDHAGPLAFGWGQLAFATVEAPWMRVAPVMGQSAVTATVAALAALAALALSGVLGVRLLSLGALLLGLCLPLLAPPPPSAPASTVRIALVQGGALHTGLGFSGNPRDVLQLHSSLSVRALQGTEAALVVWPENALDVDPYRDVVARDLLLATERAVGRPLLVGAVLTAADGRRNASLLVDGGAVRTQYVKQRLVPFGEVMPLRSLMTRWFERAQLVPLDFVPGTSAGEVVVDGLRAGIVVCFEIADETIVDAALDSDQVALILQTNNATYEGWGQSEQQLRIAQVRALMHGVPVFMVSTTGPTAVIGTDGAVAQRIEEGSTGVIVTDLPARRVSP